VAAQLLRSLNASYLLAAARPKGCSSASICLFGFCCTAPISILQKKAVVMGVPPVSGCYNINIRLILIYKLLGSLLGMGVWGSGSINIPCKN
jgi:hypothetical protein